MFALKNKKNTDKKSRDNGKKSAVRGVSRSVQDILDFQNITTDSGILRTKGGFSKLYRLIDGNFATEPDEKKWDYINLYRKLLNKFPEYVTISICIKNKRRTTEELRKDYHFKYMGDALDEYRAEYNNIIDAKIAEASGKDEDGNQNISKNVFKEKFILITVNKPTLKEAISEFNTIDITLADAVKRINGSKEGVIPVNSIERLSIMREIMHGTSVNPFEKEYERYINKIGDGEGNFRSELDKQKMKTHGVTVQDLVASQEISKDGKGKRAISLSEDRICKSFSYHNLPQSLDTKFLTDITNISYEQVTVIQFKAVPRKKAIDLIKYQNTAIKADVIKASQQAYRNGYDPNLIDEDLLLAQKQATKLRYDIVTDGKKLFYCTGISTIFARNEKELDEAIAQYQAVCADYSITPSYLLGQQIEALNTSLMIGNSRIIIDRALTLDEASAMFPFDIQELNDKNGYFYGTNIISKNMIMFDKKKSGLGNSLVFGKSGSGKSYFTKGEIIANLLNGDDDIIILDPENEYDVICEAFGGTRIDLSPKSEFCVNPLDMAMEFNDNDANPLGEKCDFMVGLVESILGKGRECNSYEVNAIHKATVNIYDRYIAEMTERHEIDPNCKDLDESICPTLIDFHEALIELNAPEAMKIATAIEPYATARGQYNLFAKKTNIPTHKRLTVYNLSKLPEKMTETAMKVCLSTIWTKIVENKRRNKLYGTNKAIWVYLDEFHLFFNSDMTASTLKAYYKRCRKYNGIICGITQDVADLLRSIEGQAIFNNTGFFAFLRQSSISQNQLANLYGLSDTMLDFIKETTPSGQGLIFNTSVWIPFDYTLPKNNKLHVLMNTDPNDEHRQHFNLVSGTKDENKEINKTTENKEMILLNKN